MKRARMLTAALTSVLLVAAPALAADDPVPFEPELKLEEAFFSCDGGETKEWTVNALLDGAYPTWTTTAPTTSIANGDGCGNANDNLFSGVRPETPFDLTFAGFFRGNLDELTVGIHNIYVGTARRSGTLTMDVRVTVDGKSLFGDTATTNAAGDVTTEPKPVRIEAKAKPTGATGAASLLEFTVTDIGLLDNAASTKNHRVVVTLATPFGANSLQNAWVWGNTEAPSYITFNPEELVGVPIATVKPD
jgi:hypothetical protein